MKKKIEIPLRKKINKLAWLFFAILSLPYFMVYFHRVAPAVVADLLMAEFNLSGAVLGNLAAIYFYMYTVMQLPAGVFADSYGPRKTIFIGMTFSGLGSIVFALAPFLSIAFLGRVLIGLGVSVIFVSLLKIVSEWFPNEKFGTMSGLALLIGNSGAIIAASPLAYMVSISGWRLSFVVVGIVCLVAGFLTFGIVKDRPAAVGLPPLNHNTYANEKFGIREIGRGLTDVMLNRFSWPPFVIFFGIYGSLMAFQGVWGIPFLVQQYGMSRYDASYNLLFIAVGLVIGCPLAGLISDKLKRRKTPLMSFTFLFICCWVMMIIWPGGKPSINILPLLFLAMGFFASGFIIVWACAKEVNAPHLSGCAMGLANMGGFLGAALMQPFFGWILDRKWDGMIVEGVRYYQLGAYRSAFVALTAILILTSISIIFLKETKATMQKSS